MSLIKYGFTPSKRSRMDKMSHIVVIASHNIQINDQADHLHFSKYSPGLISYYTKTYAKMRYFNIV